MANGVTFHIPIMFPHTFITILKTQIDRMDHMQRKTCSIYNLQIEMEALGDDWAMELFR